MRWLLCSDPHPVGTQVRAGHWTGNEDLTQEAWVWEHLEHSRLSAATTVVMYLSQTAAGQEDTRPKAAAAPAIRPGKDRKRVPEAAAANDSGSKEATH